MAKLRLVLESIHALIALLITAALPAAVYYINGSFEPWTLLFGAAAGLGYWYLFDPF